MTAKLRDAREQLSELVKRAAGGEEIIITVRGQPMARLSALGPCTSGNRNHSSFADDLEKLANSARSTTAATSESLWEELRADRC